MVAELTVTTGNGLTVTLTVAEAVHPAVLTVTVYTPFIATVEEGLLGFCEEEV
jgi:hypothetical protein